MSWLVNFTILFIFVSLSANAALPIPAVPSLETQSLPISSMEFFEAPVSSPLSAPEREIADCRFDSRKDWHFGFTDHVVWAHFKITNAGNADVSRVVALNHVYLGDVQFFTGTDCQNLRLVQATGLNRPLTSGSGSLGGYSAKVEIPRQSSVDVYVRAQSKYPLSLPIQVLTPEQHADQIASLTLMLTFYIGFVLSLMLYNLILGLITGEQTFFSYVFTIISLHLFTNLAQYGFIKEHFFPHFLFLHRNVFHLAHILSLVSVTLFVTSFLRETMPRKALRYFWTLALLTLPLSLVGIVTDSSWVDSAMQLNTTIYSLSLLVVVAQRAFTTADRPAKYFFIAWALLIFAWVINFLKISGVIPSNPLTETLILFGASNECLLLSLAIADRIRSLTVEKSEILSNLSLLNERNAIFRQVSHDIRSPVSALNMVVSTLQELPEERRLIIRSATQRINDIANGLLQQGQAPLYASESFPPAPSSTREPVMIVALLDLIISEKRLQYRERMEVEILGDLNRGYGLFVEMNATEFSRAISNLVNNSVEAFRGGGRVTISVHTERERAVITVRDNGRGVPPELIERLGEKGFTFGKESSRESGSGLGLHHARTMVESAKGTFVVQSALEIGTNVVLSFPRAETPRWFLGQLALPANATVISVDDDQTIHQIWQGRLLSLKAGAPDLKHVSFTSIDLFETWAARHSTGSHIFLIDFEFLGQTRNGLDSIDLLGIANRAILVTSRFEEPSVRRRARALGVQILPKNLAPFVPIAIGPAKEVYDAVLIDDDQLVHFTWELRARELNKKLLAFKSPEDFLAYAPKISLDSPLFIDVNLGPGLEGTVLAGKASLLGFTEIRLATGYDAASVQAPDCVQEIVGKEPRFDWL